MLARLDGPARADGLTWPDPDSKTRLVVAAATDGQLRAVVRRLVRRYAPPPSRRPADLAGDRTVPDLPPIGVLPLDRPARSATSPRGSGLPRDPADGGRRRARGTRAPARPAAQRRRLGDPGRRAARRRRRRRPAAAVAGPGRGRRRRAHRRRRAAAGLRGRQRRRVRDARRPAAARPRRTRPTGVVEVAVAVPVVDPLAVRPASGYGSRCAGPAAGRSSVHPARRRGAVPRRRRGGRAEPQAVLVDRAAAPGRSTPR